MACGPKLRVWSDGLVEYIADGESNGDGVVNVLDLIDLLLCFGQPAVPGCETEDVNLDGTVNVLDLIELLLCFGQPAVPACESEDINTDGTVDVLDLIDLLLVFGTTCP